MQAMMRRQGLTRARGRCARLQATAGSKSVQLASSAVRIVESAQRSTKGTVRKINEDRSQIDEINGAGGLQYVVAVHDGHGGYAVADWLTKNLSTYIQKKWNPTAPEQALTDAFLAADSRLLSNNAGFMGMGERGVGGSKCGATSAVVCLYTDPKDSATMKMIAANIGDARTVLVSGGKAMQLSVDHVPDDESERKRIERFNPNPKMPLVRYVAGTWRVGGLLALSRAFGDAYMKGSLQFEGIPEGSDGYSSGFGVIAEPYTEVRSLSSEDSWLIVASDGLFAEESRGGGGGLDNEQLLQILQSAGDAPCGKIADQLISTAVSMGSTDDVTVCVLRLGTGSSA